MSNLSPIILTRGETRSDTLTVTDPTGVTPQTITDCEIFLVVRTLRGVLVPELCRQTDAGIIHDVQVGATLGQATITWEFDAAADVAHGQYEYIVYVIDSLAQRQVVIDWSPFEVLNGEITLPAVE